jgi:hypothetical protein
LLLLLLLLALLKDGCDGPCPVEGYGSSSSNNYKRYKGQLHNN